MVFIAALYEEERLLVKGEGVWEALQDLMDQAGELGERIHALERGEIGKLNRAIDDLRLQERRLQTREKRRATHCKQGASSSPVGRVRSPVGALGRATGTARVLGGGGCAGRGESRARVAVAAIVRAYRPNLMSTKAKVQDLSVQGLGIRGGRARANPTPKAEYSPRSLAR